MLKNPLTALSCATLLGTLLALPVPAGTSGAVIRGKLTQIRTGTMQAAASADSVGNEFRPTPEVDQFFAKGGVSSARVPAAHVPTPTDSAVTGPNASFFGFSGLTHRDQRRANGGNQFSLQPPDPALAVGNGFILEAVNTALAVYDQAGHRLSGPTALNPFFGLAAEAARDPNTGAIVKFGPFTSDPKCYYDPPTGRWFVTILEVDTDPANGNLLTTSSVRIAVSKTSDPAGEYYLYSLDTTASGLPDQSLIGADANGFYVSINSFLFPNFAFNGGQIFAISKTTLESGSLSPVVLFGNLQQAEGPGYSIQPANVDGLGIGINELAFHHALVACSSGKKLRISSQTRFGSFNDL